MKDEKSFVFGLHAVESLLNRQPERVARVVILKDRRDQKVEHILELAHELKLEVEFAPRHQLDRLSQNETHQGVIAYCRKPKVFSEHDLESILDAIDGPPLLLILDGVQDPHNLGACLRSADATGVHAVIAPRDQSVGVTPTVAKVACGAADTVPFVQVTNLARTLKSLQERNIWIYGAAGEAEKDLFHADLTGGIAFVLGAEGAGLRRLTREHCDVLLKIPMMGSVSSLNVSVATGVFLFEAVRQRIALSK